MSSSERRLGRRALGLLLAGAGSASCNLHPLHGGSQGAEVDRELASIEVTSSLDRLGQQLKNYLIDDLNPRGATEVGRYELTVRLQSSRSSLIVQRSGESTRYELILAAFFELRDKEGSKVLYRSAARRVSSFNLRREPFASEISQQNAQDRAARELSTYIRTQLAIYFSTRTA